jgi:hypothetical protein
MHVILLGSWIYGILNLEASDKHYCKSVWSLSEFSGLRSRVDMPALFRVVTQPMSGVAYRCFRTAYWSHFQYKAVQQSKNCFNITLHEIELKYGSTMSNLNYYPSCLKDLHFCKTHEYTVYVKIDINFFYSRIISLFAF